MTLSILAFDRSEQLVGAAVTSCALAAGRRILHVRPSVGAAVAQASSEITWGEDILDRLQDGTGPDAAIDPFRQDATQVAAIDFAGNHAVHTGNRCDTYAGHAHDDAVVAQANTAALADAWDRMITAYLGCTGLMAERLVAALDASGGDAARGHQGAAVIVTGFGPLRGYADEPHVDLRVDDHRNPVGELRRLLALHRAHCEMRRIQDVPEEQRTLVIEALSREHPGDPHLERALRRLTSST